MRHPLDTVVAIAPTPFDPDGDLDAMGLGRVIDRLVDGGIATVTINGNTGEFSALSEAELVLATDVASDLVAERASLIVGTGGALATAVAVARRAADRGAYGVMVHEPPGPTRSMDGWLRYHAEIAEAAGPIGMIPYVRDPSIGASAIQRLVETCPTVVGVKYAIPDPVAFARTVDDVDAPGLAWCCGLAESWAPFFWVGGATGFTSGLASVAPDLSLRMLRELASADRPAAQRTWHLLRPFEELRARRSNSLNVAAVKEALAQLGIMGRAVRPPLSELDDEDRDEVAAILSSWSLARDQPA